MFTAPPCTSVNYFLIFIYLFILKMCVYARVYVCACCCVRAHVCMRVGTHRHMPAMACVVAREQLDNFQESVLASSCESQVLNSCLPACAHIAFTSEVTLRVPFKSYMRN